jgi:hypothetical protein
VLVEHCDRLLVELSSLASLSLAAAMASSSSSFVLPAMDTLLERLVWTNYDLLATQAAVIMQRPEQNE